MFPRSAWSACARPTVNEELEPSPERAIRIVVDLKAIINAEVRQDAAHGRVLNFVSRFHALNL
jgi:hypothetical protein